MAPMLELTMDGSTDAGSRYLTWSPVLAQLRVLDASGARGPTIDVDLRNVDVAVGRLVLRFGHGDPPDENLHISLAADGTPSSFFLAGAFGSPSTGDRDGGLEVVDGQGTVLAVFPTMVRIRKDAESLTDGERARFLLALAQLNDHGRGAYQDFRDAHLDNTTQEAHGLDGFLPWHRAYILDLERALQAIDPSVTLPYWRFDRPAPTLFTSDFLGAPDPNGITRFAPSNPLGLWSTDGLLGIDRTPFFDTAGSPAHDRNGQGVVQERPVVTFSRPYGELRPGVENDPHGAAHTSFSGSISVIGTAPRDPLFFLLHCNVDRLWAKWQWFQNRRDSTSSDTYTFSGAAGDAGSTRIGHNSLDTMWPWNADTQPPRPRTAPRTPFPHSPWTPSPGPAPTVGSMIDYQDVRTKAAGVLGFDYDDVPYEP